MIGHLGGWNWGAFLLNWIWAWNNIGAVWGIAGLFSGVIPFGSMIFSVFMGIKGNDLAWENRHFNSIQEFKDVQGKWSAWGAGIWGFSMLFVIIMIFIAAAADL